MNDPRKSLFRHCEAFDATAAKAAATQGLLRLNARTLSCRGTRRRRVARLSMNHTRNLLISLRSPLPGFLGEGSGERAFSGRSKAPLPLPLSQKSLGEGSKKVQGPCAVSAETPISQ